MKKKYLAKKLDLLSEFNYQAMIKVFKKDRDRKAERSVHKARQNQVEHKEYERRCALARQTLYPRANKDIEITHELDVNFAKKPSKSPERPMKTSVSPAKKQDSLFGSPRRDNTGNASPSLFSGSN